MAIVFVLFAGRRSIDHRFGCDDHTFFPVLQMNATICAQISQLNCLFGSSDEDVDNELQQHRLRIRHTECRSNAVAAHDQLSLNRFKFESWHERMNEPSQNINKKETIYGIGKRNKIDETDDDRAHQMMSSERKRERASNCWCCSEDAARRQTLREMEIVTQMLDYRVSISTLYQFWGRIHTQRYSARERASVTQMIKTKNGSAVNRKQCSVDNNSLRIF